RRADQIVVETQSVKDRLASLLGIDPAKIAVIANGLNPVFRNYRQGENETDGCTRILVPSAYYPHKNLEIIPEVAAAIRKADPGLGFQFQLTLDPESQPWRALHRKTMALDAQNFVTTLGVLTLDDLARAYQKAAAVFLPTLREASTSVYPESFYFRRPLVTSDRDFARELCGDAALFIPPRDADAIAHCLIKLLRSPDLGKGLAEAGERQLARRYPDPDTKFAMQLELMMQVACQGKRTRFHVNAGSTEGDDGFRQYRSGWNRSEIGRG
ncbi:MAG TPA: glycosyltransferase family 4 protein, partial [Hyphomicrobiales bacterium]|nr:glycosyltransferase family 4 protein [Hyphomicrobiales bacterium]